MTASPTPEATDALPQQTSAPGVLLHKLNYRMKLDVPAVLCYTVVFTPQRIVVLNISQVAGFVAGWTFGHCSELCTHS